jgi:hypothetical protein
MKRFVLLSLVGLGALVGVSALSTPVLAASCDSLMTDPNNEVPKQYCCTFTSQHGTLTGNQIISVEAAPGSVQGADFNIQGALSGTGANTDIGCSCQATGAVANPNFDNSSSFICAGPASDANGFQNHSAIVGKATGKTILKGQMLYNTNNEPLGQLYDSVMFSCTTNLNACAGL